MSFGFLAALPPYAWASFITGALTLFFGVFVLVSNPKPLTNRLYFWFCVGIATWLLFSCLLTSRMFSIETSTLLSKGVYTGVIFLPTLALHFVLSFLAVPRLKKRADLLVAYAGSIVFLALLWTTDLFIPGIYDYSWGRYPRGGPVHLPHTLFLIATAIYADYLLYQGMRRVEKFEGRTRRYYETKYLFLAFAFVICGSSDFLHNRGIDFFPIGCIFVVIFIAATTYAIFKHQLMGLTLVIRKSIAYSLLLSVITALYFALVYLASAAIGDLTNLHSLPMIVAILAIITMVFKPLETKIQGLVDKLFLKKSRAEIERENTLLLLEMQKQDRMKAVATLAAGMAHEIKNPLTSLKTFAEHLAEKYDEPEFRSKFSRIVTEEVDRINNIVKQVLDFSKPQVMDPVTLNVSELIEDTLQLLSVNILRSEITISKHLAPSLHIRGDKNQLRQVFLNILLNSIQSMPRGGHITISSSEHNGSVCTTVKDSGPGIGKDDLEHIFDPFFTTKETGTGLGLSIVHGIVKEHGGTITVESSPGNGAKVTIIFEGVR